MIKKTADSPVVQSAIIHTLLECKLQKVIAGRAGSSLSDISKHVHRKQTGKEKCERKRCRSRGDGHRFERKVKESQFKNLGEICRDLD